jgi:hypothetical protein
MGMRESRMAGHPLPHRVRPVVHRYPGCKSSLIIPSGPLVTERADGETISVLRTVRLGYLIPGWPPVEGPRFGYRGPCRSPASPARLSDSTLPARATGSMLYRRDGDQAGFSGCGSGQMFIEDSEDLAVHWSLRLGAECAQVGCAERIGILMQELGSLSDTGARGGKVAAA